MLQPVAFNDLAVLHNELEVRRRRELIRQESQRTEATGSSGGDVGGRGGAAGGAAQNFQSLPWEEIILPAAYARDQKQHQQSTGSRWLSQAKNVFGGRDVSGKRQQQADLNGHWFLKERSPEHHHHHSPMHSMPPVSGSLKDSGIGADDHVLHLRHQQEATVNRMTGGSRSKSISNLSRTGTGRSSFGIILKDKFQKNPNVYFPKGAAGAGATETSRGGSSKSEDEIECDMDHLSDSDVEEDAEVVGRNRDEAGSSLYGGEEEKECSMSSSSGKGSSMSPHNSMEGSPRMMFHGGSEPATNNASEVSMGKKTIRNYMPKESGNMLRELENQRRNRRMKEEEDNLRGKVGKAKSQLRSKEPARSGKTSVERMIEDFHKNLPESKEEDEMTELTVGGRSSTVPSTTHSKRKEQVGGSTANGTMTSQISSWSTADGSSVASFDYLQGPVGGNGGGIGGSGRSRNKAGKLEASLPVVSESVDYTARLSPEGERVGPEGASSESPLPQKNFVQRIEVKAELHGGSGGKEKKGKKKIISHGEDVGDLVQGEGDEDDDFSNLRKLISEGRITGLNEKPPSFVPPTPPSTTKPVGGSSSGGSGENRGRRAKNPAPKPTRSQSQPGINKQPSRKTKEAPKPPQKKLAEESEGEEQADSDVEDAENDAPVTSRLRGVESVEDLTKMDERRGRNREGGGGSAGVKRSPSHHETKTSTYFCK